MNEEFWSKAVRDGDCLVWQRAKTTAGYGEHYAKGRPGGAEVYAHRYAWEITNGPIPRGGHILHRCDRPACIEPTHLFLGDNTDNMRDCAQKGRFNRALNPDLVRRIREMRQAGAPYRAIGQAFGVTHATARKAALGHTWGFVE